MGIRMCVLMLSCVAAVMGQSVKSSIEFYDTTVNTKMGEIGSSGNATNSTFFIESNGTKRVVITNDTVAVDGQIKATSFIGDGSKLTGIATTSSAVSWENITNVPAGFADGVDNAGNGEVTVLDSVRASSIADSTKKIPDGSVTNAKLAATIKISDVNLDSISWSKIKGIPSGFADGVDNSEITNEGNATDSVRAASIADSCKKIPDGSVTAAKLSSTFKIDADSLGGKASGLYALKTDLGTTTVDTATYATNAGSLGGQAASLYALKADLTTTTVDSVRASKIADTAKTVRDGAVTAAKLASSAVATANIAASAVTTAKLASAAVATANIADAAVTKAKLATGISVPNADSLGGVAASKYSQTGHTHTEYYTQAQVDTFNVVDYYNGSESSSGYSSVSTGSVSRLASVTINAPAAGHVIVSASAGVQIGSVTAETNLFMDGGISKSSSITMSDDLLGGVGILHDFTSDNLLPWAVTRGFSVTKGSNTFYLYFRNKGSSAAINIWNVSMTAIYSNMKNGE